MSAHHSSCKIIVLLYILRTSLIISEKNINLLCISVSIVLISAFPDHNQETAFCILFLLVICNSTIGRILLGNKKTTTKKENCHDYTIHNFNTIYKLHYIWCLNPFHGSFLFYLKFMNFLFLFFFLSWFPTFFFVFFFKFTLSLAFIFQSSLLLFFFFLKGGIVSIFCYPCYCNLVWKHAKSNRS